MPHKKSWALRRECQPSGADSKMISQYPQRAPQRKSDGPMKSRRNGPATRQNPRALTRLCQLTPCQLTPGTLFYSAYTPKIGVDDPVVSGRDLLTPSS